jgi:hypothetical protein
MIKLIKKIMVFVLMFIQLILIVLSILKSELSFSIIATILFFPIRYLILTADNKR